MTTYTITELAELSKILISIRDAQQNVAYWEQTLARAQEYCNNPSISFRTHDEGTYSRNIDVSIPVSVAFITEILANKADKARIKLAQLKLEHNVV